MPPPLLKQDDYVLALVDGEALCNDLKKAREDEEAANAGLEKARKFPLPSHREQTDAPFGVSLRG